MRAKIKDVLKPSGVPDFVQLPGASDINDYRSALISLQKYLHKISSLIGGLAESSKDLMCLGRSFYGDGGPYTKSVNKCLSIISSCEEERSQMDKSLEVSHQQLQSLISNVQGIRRVLDERDKAWQRRQHYDRKLDKLKDGVERSRASGRSESTKQEKVERNEGKYQCAINDFERLDKTAKESIQKCLATKYENFNNIFIMILNCERIYFTSIGKSMEKLDIYLNDIKIVNSPIIDTGLSRIIDNMSDKPWRLSDDSPATCTVGRPITRQITSDSSSIGPITRQISSVQSTDYDFNTYLPTATTAPSSISVGGCNIYQTGCIGSREENTGGSSNIYQTGSKVWSTGGTIGSNIWPSGGVMGEGNTTGFTSIDIGYPSVYPSKDQQIDYQLSNSNPFLMSQLNSTFHNSFQQSQPNLQNSMQSQMQQSQLSQQQSSMQSQLQEPQQQGSMQPQQSQSSMQSQLQQPQQQSSMQPQQQSSMPPPKQQSSMQSQLQQPQQQSSMLPQQPQSFMQSQLQQLQQQSFVQPQQQSLMQSQLQHSQQQSPMQSHVQQPQQPRHQQSFTQPQQQSPMQTQQRHHTFQFPPSPQLPPPHQSIYPQFNSPAPMRPQLNPVAQFQLPGRGGPGGGADGTPQNPFDAFDDLVQSSRSSDV
eukprot:GHVL01035282.1.p1 GENE.GHVL01035282.1~~GHVL01035282.1.p1  ORF type:complete len:648 (+),score=174.33 GHVL01035282.1:57-2000(+)